MMCHTLNPIHQGCFKWKTICCQLVSGEMLSRRSYARQYDFLNLIRRDSKTFKCFTLFQLPEKILLSETLRSSRKNASCTNNNNNKKSVFKIWKKHHLWLSNFIWIGFKIRVWLRLNKHEYLYIIFCSILNEVTL